MCLGQRVENQHYLQVAFQEEAENNLLGQRVAPNMMELSHHSSTHLADYLCLTHQWATSTVHQQCTAVDHQEVLAMSSGEDKDVVGVAELLNSDTSNDWTRLAEAGQDGKVFVRKEHCQVEIADLVEKLGS